MNFGLHNGEWDPIARLFGRAPMLLRGICSCKGKCICVPFFTVATSMTAGRLGVSPQADYSFALHQGCKVDSLAKGSSQHAHQILHRLECDWKLRNLLRGHEATIQKVFILYRHGNSDHFGAQTVNLVMVLYDVMQCEHHLFSCSQRLSENSDVDQFLLELKMIIQRQELSKWLTSGNVMSCGSCNKLMADLDELGWSR